MPDVAADDVAENSTEAVAQEGTAEAVAQEGTAEAAAQGGTAEAVAQEGTAEAVAEGGTAEAVAQGCTAEAVAPLHTTNEETSKEQGMAALGAENRPAGTGAMCEDGAPDAERSGDAVESAAKAPREPAHSQGTHVRTVPA